MHIRIIAERRGQALLRLQTSAEAVGERLGFTEPVAALRAASFPRDPQVEMVRRLEALADLLQAIEAAQAAPQPAAPAPKGRR